MRRSSLHVSSEMLVTGSTRTTRGHVPSLYHLKVLLTADVIQSSRCTAAAFIISPKNAAHRSDAAAPNKQMMFRYIYIYIFRRQGHASRGKHICRSHQKGKAAFDLQSTGHLVQGLSGRMSEPATCSFCFASFF